MKILLCFFASVLIFSCNTSGNLPDEDDLQDGDLIFQESTSAQSKAIQLATHSKYSHCGIIFKGEGECFVVEAVQPVQSTPVKDWIKRGKGGHYVVKRLKDADDILTPRFLGEMKKIARLSAGKDYDLHFSWDNDKMYCSELIWKIYNQKGKGPEIGRLQKLKDFDLSNPVVKQKLTERYGNKIPYNEKVISPAEMFDSELLETIISE
ncbi:YiiX family permuted papain-like enzyme [Flavobacterium sp. DGU11]|uniref:YiiX family permuted papain-like enzyme n=1 Tax=Flavobacterium arundinis TaxID=3139143 RepID=A0ABU9HWB5_9FLAO